jgi:poly(3-hydroxybutyrate) depolymerase
LFLCGRGRFAAKLVEASKTLAIDLRDSTLPDVLSDAPSAMPLGIVVRNASNKTVPVTLQGTADRGRQTVQAVLPPFSMRKLPLNISTDNGKIRLAVLAGGRVVDEAELTLRVRKSTEIHKRTFISGIDGSVQYYGVNPSLQPAPDQALFLSLHGASVEAIGQAEAYGQKSWGTFVAPTNRRPFGFDWEEIGRLDALEVLQIARQEFQPNPSRIYLTGHSMGGHGAWHLGAHYPHLFAAVAPSAGWISFQTYAGGQAYENAGPVEQMLLRAGAASDTLALKNNLLQRPIYILHGDADDNVPVAQARQMRQVLAGHKDLDWHEQKGAGHWWDVNPEPGADAVDFGPIFDFFAKSRLPRITEVREVDFTTVSPGVSSQLHWATIHQQIKPFIPSRIQLRADPLTSKFSGTTENVSVLSLSIGALAKGQKIQLDIDGQKLEPTWPTVNRIFLFRKNGAWTVGGDPPPTEKSPLRYGTFKDVFKNRIAFVYGTRGSREENAWSLAKARYDAETFWYRGNGSVDVIPDTALPTEPEERNYLVYGNSSVNGAWDKLLRDSPIQVDRKGVRMGSRSLAQADLAAVFIRPLAKSELGSVGVIAGTGMVGNRLCDRIPVFTSGSAFPDVLVLGSDSLVSGTKGIRLTGFFGNDWSVDEGDFAP